MKLEPTVVENPPFTVSCKCRICLPHGFFTISQLTW